MKQRVIHKDGIVKQIPISQLETYLAEGWSLGRGKPAWNKGVTAEMHPSIKACSEKLKGRKRTDQEKEHLSKLFKGRKLTETWLANRTAAQTGLKRSEAFKEAQRQRALGHEVSTETREKISQKTKGKSHPVSEETKQKISKHNSSEEFQKYQREVKRKNKSFNSSKPEELAYKEVCRVFGDFNIIRNFGEDPRYPFECDLYIKPLDLFIELNYHWTHGPHIFDQNDPTDQQLLGKWRSKQYITSKGKKNFYIIAEEVWTKRDTRKVRTAAENNLNYLIFYTQAEFLNWIKTVETNRSSKVGQLEQELNL